MGGRTGGASALDRSLDSYLDHLATERGLARRSVEAYGRDLVAFVRSLTARRVRRPQEIGADDVRAHLAALAGRGLAPRSQARALAAVRSYLKWATRELRLREDPAAQVHIRRPPGHLPDALGQGDTARLVTATVPGGRRPQRDRALLELLYASGLRVSEAVALKVHEVNLEAGYVTVLGKGGKERVVPMGQHARDAVTEYLGGERPRLLHGTASAWLFVRAGGRPLSRQTVWKLVRARARAAAVDAHVSPHTATPLPPTSSVVVPTSGWCRRCSVMPTSGRRRSTRTWPRPGCERYTAAIIHEHSDSGSLRPLGPEARLRRTMEVTAVMARVAIVAVPLLVAVVLHEVAHGVVAYACGDPTAARAGRLTLNPIAHIDPVGSILVPGLLVMLSGPFIRLGQARPHRSTLFRRPRLDGLLVALAGPGTNLTLAVLSAVALGGLAASVTDPTPTTRVLASLARQSIIVNCVLAVFNLLPVPPLDGGRVLAAVLPPDWARMLERVERIGIVVVLLVVMNTGILSRLVQPVVAWCYALARQVAG